MFWSKNKKNRYTPANPSFAILKWGIKGYIFTWTCFPDDLVASIYKCTKYSDLELKTLKRNNRVISLN